MNDFGFLALFIRVSWFVLAHDSIVSPFEFVAAYPHMVPWLVNHPVLCVVSFEGRLTAEMDDMLDFARACIDVVVFFSHTWEDHVKNLCSVFQKITQVGLTAKPSKYQWATASCICSRHVVGRGKV